MTKKLSAITLVLATVFLTSCGGGGSENSEVASEEANLESPWNCETEQEALGESFSCSTGAYDSSRNYWTLMLMCDSDKLTKHAIVGLDPQRRNVTWPIGENNYAKIQIDNKSFEQWKIGTKGGGQGVFFKPVASSNLNGDYEENLGSWRLMTAIAGAETMNFQGIDLYGNTQSVEFNVENSVPIAAKFAVLGCGSN